MENETTQALIRGISSDAIVGVVATLLGTVLGWLLGLLQNRGRLVAFIGSWKEAFTCGSGVFDGKAESIQEAKCYSFDLVIELYNSSHLPRIARDICIVYTCKAGRIRKKELLRCTPKDKATAHQAGGGTRYDQVSAINIGPNEIVTLTLHQGFTRNGDSLEFREKADMVFFEYRDARNHTHRKLISKLD